jgi:hypothetical protein
MQPQSIYLHRANDVRLIGVTIGFYLETITRFSITSSSSPASR